MKLNLITMMCSTLFQHHWGNAVTVSCKPVCNVILPLPYWHILWCSTFSGKSIERLFLNEITRQECMFFDKLNTWQIKVMYLNCLFCPANSLNPKDIQFAVIKSLHMRRWNQQVFGIFVWIMTKTINWLLKYSCLIDGLIIAALITLLQNSGRNLVFP